MHSANFLLLIDRWSGLEEQPGRNGFVFGFFLSLTFCYFLSFFAEFWDFLKNILRISK